MQISVIDSNLILVDRAAKHSPRTFQTLLMTEEKRRAPRLRTLKGGLITFGIAARIDCIIRNMSETGAALEVQSQAGIPGDFTLLIKPEIIKRKCQVIWREGKRIGVKFV